MVNDSSKKFSEKLVDKKIIQTVTRDAVFREKFDLRDRGKNLFFNIFKKLAIARISPRNIYPNVFDRAYFH